MFAKDNVPDPHTGEVRAKHADELQVRWQSLVVRIRVHEMLKCLRGEHNKLQILREHTDVNEILKTRFAELTVAKRKKEEDELMADKEIFDAKSEEKPKDKKKAAALSIQKRLEQARMKEEIMNREENALFVRTQNEEEEAVAEIYPNLKRVLADPKYIAKAAVKMFRTRTAIDEVEFEEILALCDDKLEQQALRNAFSEKQNRDRFLHNADEKRQMLYNFINSTFFVRFMLVTIIVSIFGICLLTFEHISIKYAFPLQILDACIIGIFVVEAIFKIMIYSESYFKKMWNILDIIIILVHITEVLVELITKTLALSTNITENHFFKILKSLRALRLLRIIKFLPNLQVIVTTVFQSILSLGSIAVLMSLFIFVFAVLGRGLFFERSPKHFGHIGLAFVTLFQLLTLDDWFELLDYQLEFKLDEEAKDEDQQYWIMFAYLFAYLIMEYFVFLNLFVAVLVDNFQLTLADAAARKQKEALIYQEGKEKYDEVNQGKNGDVNTEEDPEEDLIHNSEFVNPENLELKVEDYFAVGKGSREHALLEHIFKDLHSIDFVRYLWKRRQAIVELTLDRGIQRKTHRWRVQDGATVNEKSKRGLEAYQNYG